MMEIYVSKIIYTQTDCDQEKMQSVCYFIFQNNKNISGAIS